MSFFPRMHRILPVLACLAGLAAHAADPVELAASLDQAASRVREIVNQPVPSFPAGPDDHPALFHPGWFHPGALTPDFAHVDIRASQECASYVRWDYVTSDLNPGVMFQGSAVEFNPMTKLFYTDRTQPKKKLTEAEMEEINGLYRTIGECLAQWRQHPVQSAPPGSPGGLPLELAAAVPPVPGQASPDPAGSGDSGLLTVRNGLAAVVVLALALAWIRLRRRAA
jgi:hypothetical protein